jgi:hypothetical protein
MNLVILFFLRMYPSILSFETINKLKLFFECGILRPQDVGHRRLRYSNGTCSYRREAEICLFMLQFSSTSVFFCPPFVS